MKPSITDPATMRWLATPMPVEVDPCAVIVLPRQWPRPNQRALGVLAGGLDLRLDQPWLFATLHRWLRTRLSFWIAEVEILYTSHNGTIEVPLRQWVSEDAVRLPRGDGQAVDVSGGR